ncbi:MAG: hypothetical protein AAGA91_14985 [Pseudomonadota bacterium]
MIRVTSVLGTISMVMFGAQSFAQDSSNPEAERCQYAAEHMIEVARQSLNEQSSRPERVEKRRQLVEDWSTRLEGGEDPCSVYADIQQQAATF